MAAALNQHGRFNDRAAALAGAALAHAALLAPLALGALGLEFARVEDSEAPALLIQLEPRSTAPPPPQSVASAREAAAPDRRPRPVRLPPEVRPTPRPVVVQTDAPPMDGGWRVRPAIGGAGWGDCPEAFRNPSAQNLCNERNRLRAAAPPPVSGPPAPRVQPSGAPTDDRFARAAAANEAWRNYTRNDGAYPGLKSLFRDR